MLGYRRVDIGLLGALGREIARGLYAGLGFHYNLHRDIRLEQRGADIGECVVHLLGVELASLAELREDAIQALGRRIKDEPTGIDYLKMLAVSRLFLDNIENFQSSWLTQGLRLGQVALRFGANDITGRSSIEFWTKSKKMTTKWNQEHGTNWMS